MSYESVKKRLDVDDIIILDGATGTELERRGATMDPASWCGPASLKNQELQGERSKNRKSRWFRKKAFF